VKGSDEIILVELSGHADRANIHAPLRALVNLERDDSMSAFRRRADAVAWLVRKPDAP